MKIDFDDSELEILKIAVKEKINSIQLKILRHQDLLKNVSLKLDVDYLKYVSTALDLEKRSLKSSEDLLKKLGGEILD